MNEPDNRKDKRRQKFLSKNHSEKDNISEEQRYVSRSKKELKKRLEDMREEELWEDWKNQY